MGRRPGLEYVDVRKILTLREFELRPLARPVRIQSLYRLRHRGSQNSAWNGLISYSVSQLTCN